MELLQKRILKDGRVLPSGVVQVDNFLNHMVDPILLSEMGKAIAEKYKNEQITKVLTIEASGIAIASFAALALSVPFIFAKKQKSNNLDGEHHTASVYSFTKETEYQIRVAKKLLTENDRVLIVDDFLAMGSALLGLCDLIKSAGATVAGCAIAIEKAWLKGGEKVRATGVPIYSLAKIMSIRDGTPIFEEE